jgi:hypothetical protein
VGHSGFVGHYQRSNQNFQPWDPLLEENTQLPVPGFESFTRQRIGVELIIGEGPICDRESPWIA